jgi:hypothetical protein
MKIATIFHARYINLCLLAFAVLAMPTTVLSGDGSGRVTRIYAHEKNGGAGVIMFSVENHSNPPASCPGHEWAFDANDAQGKAMYALLLAAASQGKPIIPESVTSN